MPKGVVLLLIAMIVCWPQRAPAAIAQGSPKGVAPTAAIYIAKGGPDSCGPGCNRWIVVEGQLDKGAAARFRNVLRSPKAVGLPVYLHSPGGEVRQAMAIGRMLRERKATARVARTVVRDCSGDGQTGAACLKLKQSGKELEAELLAAAECNSACAYLLVGAVVREVPPGVTVGVHTARTTLSIRGGTVSPAVREQLLRRAIDNLNRDLAAYLAAMGIDRALLDLVRTVKFESMHALTRAELSRFGIDRRDFVETDWFMVEVGQTPLVGKLVEIREASDAKTFRRMGWRLTCASGSRMVLSYRGGLPVETHASTVLRFGADEKVVMGAGGRADLRAAYLEREMVEKLKGAARLSLMEVAKATDAAGAEPQARETVLSTAGLSRSIEQLTRSCRI